MSEPQLSPREELLNQPLLRSRTNSLASLPTRLLQPTAAPTSAPMERGIESENDNVKVCCRIRPFNDRETGLHTKEQEKLSPRSRMPMRSVIDMAGADTIFLDPSDYSERERFGFDESLWSVTDDQQTSANSYCSQQDVFDRLGAPVLRHAWKGFNSCVFAYGQTGSGKTYTMMGTEEDPGLIPRICTELFEQVHAKQKELQQNATPLQEVTMHVEVRFLEIYIEKVHDLLASNADPQTRAEGLRVRHHPTQGPFVEGLNSFYVQSWEDCKRLINIGNAERITAETKMNERSSRSHAVFKLTFIQTTKSIPKNKFERPTVNERYSHISLVDLAGSERNKKSEAVGIHLTEAANINKSLSTLKKVIDSLVEVCEAAKLRKKVKINIPFRESTLTWLLSDNLGGNSKTTMLCTVSPHVDNAEESLLTLRYGLRARGIVCSVRVNEDTAAKQILELQIKLKELQHQAELTAADDTKDMLLDEIEVGRKAIESMQGKIREEEERSRGLSEAIQKERHARYQGAYYQSLRFLANQRMIKERQDKLAKDLLNEKENLSNALEKIERLETERKALDHKLRTMGSDNDSLTLQLDQAKVKIQELQRENQVISHHVRDTREKDQELERYKELVSMGEIRRANEVSQLQTRVCISKILGTFKLRRQRKAFETLLTKELQQSAASKAQVEKEFKRQIDALTTLMADSDLGHSDEIEELTAAHKTEVKSLEDKLAQRQKRIQELESQLAQKESEELKLRLKYEERSKVAADEWYSKSEDEKIALKQEIAALKKERDHGLEAMELSYRNATEARVEEVREQMQKTIGRLTAELDEAKLQFIRENETLRGESNRITRAQETYIDDLRQFVKDYCNTDSSYKLLHTRILDALSRKDFNKLSIEELRKLLVSYASEYEVRPVRIELQRFVDPANRGEHACDKPPQIRGISPQPGVLRSARIKASASPERPGYFSARSHYSTATNASGKIPIRRPNLKPKVPQVSNMSF
eukprot:PhF_6_TR36543/c0_g1_i1/m.53892/K17914/KIF13; kinesin family member 13